MTEHIMVNGVKIMPPAPADEDGLYWFCNPLSGVRHPVRSSDVAAACEVLLGTLVAGRMGMGLVLDEARFHRLREFVMQNDMPTYMALID